jgi:hypothetical protein
MEYGEVEVKLHSFLISTLGRDEVSFTLQPLDPGKASQSRSGRRGPAGNQIPVVQTVASHVTEWDNPLERE